MNNLFPVKRKKHLRRKRGQIPIETVAVIAERIAQRPAKKRRMERV